ncbi:hypothetical protein COLO4_14266 [Corchorus olitorius]|uniref:Uncharacterized protein n=1 Tax=Corchorus olitorius TaxID=93759 RepID=A0A1R3JSS4_9ROSI|nr:hypothetical protein COLO4_14266 [Corchorus olitorius]
MSPNVSVGKKDTCPGNDSPSKSVFRSRSGDASPLTTWRDLIR